MKGQATTLRCIHSNRSKKNILYNKKTYGYNIIRNQRYTWFNFIFLVFIKQFSSFLNINFILNISLQFFERYRTINILTTMSPWLFVLMFSYLKEGKDDFNRYKRDKELNEEKYKVVRENGIQAIFAKDITVGDILIIEKSQRVPADMILLKSNEKTGHVFIRTDQLDGETDWKLRCSVSTLHALESFDMGQMYKITVYADKPHKAIDSFMGRIEIDGEEIAKLEESLEIENTLWMNTILTNTSALGIVIYVGKDTRAVMNTIPRKNKIGITDRELNVYSILLFMMSLTVAALFTFLRGIWINFDITLIKFLVIFSSCIPISLKVTLDWARFFYVREIHQDEELKGCTFRNSDIPEELGRITYLLSDKTGTLTRNEMEMKKVHLGTICYSDESIKEIKELLWNLELKGKNKSFFTKRGSDLRHRLLEVVAALSVCHNVTPCVTDSDNPDEYNVEPINSQVAVDQQTVSNSINNESTEIGLERDKALPQEFDGNNSTDVRKTNLQGSSPDEIAILEWVEKLGFSLKYRDKDRIEIEDQKGEIHIYKILFLFPFTSERKRMGIIVKKENTDEILFYIKGADIVMKDIVKENDWLEEEVDNMASEGLRTLVIAKKKLTTNEFKKFSDGYKLANLEISDRKDKIKSLHHVLEKDCQLLGLTGVEDKLQEDVEITLETLRNAGIKIWMLTGDKLETAICIAISSRLFIRDSNYFVITGLKTRADGFKIFDSFKESLSQSVVIDGESIQVLLDNFPKEFLEMGAELSTVVVCRVTPTQKALITRCVRSHNKERVCCVGDGGNDVSMITESDLGIGIIGKEGNHAALASDISITEFRHLSTLFLWHGRNFYKRTLLLIYLIIHRGTIISVIEAIFSSLFLFAPVSLFMGKLMVGYTSYYTNFCIFTVTFSYETTRTIIMNYPELYRDLVKSKQLGMKNFIYWNLIGFYQGCVIMFLSLYLFEHEMFLLKTLTFSNLLINEILVVVLSVPRLRKMMWYAAGLNIYVYILSLPLVGDELAIPDSWIDFFWKLILINLTAISISVTIKIWKTYFRPSQIQKLDFI